MRVFRLQLKVDRFGQAIVEQLHDSLSRRLGEVIARLVHDPPRT